MHHPIFDARAPQGDIWSARLTKSSWTEVQFGVASDRLTPQPDIRILGHFNSL